MYVVLISSLFCFISIIIGNVPTKCKKNRALGRWVSTQRAMYKNYMGGRSSRGIAKDEIVRRIARLEELGFCFSMLMPGDSETESNKVPLNTLTGWTDYVPGSFADDEKRKTIRNSQVITAGDCGVAKDEPNHSGSETAEATPQERW
jgi:Helicase associated domain